MSLRLRGPRLGRKILELGAVGYGLGRSVHYLLQARALQLLSRLWVRGGFPTRPETLQSRRILFDKALAFIREDAEYFGSGIFPLALLRPENPLRHGLRTARLAADGLRALRQRQKGRTQVFSEEARDRADEKPRYYQRNFHFQEDGYLSDRSAELYEHQVEVLFVGTADMMRRLALRALVEHFGEEAVKSGGKGLKLLEIAAGTGRTSRMVKVLFPKAQLVVSDLSEVYLKRARGRLQGVDRVDFVQAAGEKLPFQDAQFDAVFSVFLFHELPLEVRSQVIAEKARVTRAGGLVAAVDSIQLHDEPDFAAVLEQFPKDFHEPFYRNYIETPLEGLFEQAGLKDVRHRKGLLSKLVNAVRS